MVVYVCVDAKRESEVHVKQIPSNVMLSLTPFSHGLLLSHALLIQLHYGWIRYTLNSFIRNKLILFHPIGAESTESCAIVFRFLCVVVSRAQITHRGYTFQKSEQKGIVMNVR